MAQRLRETNALLSQRAAKDVVKEFEDNLTWGQRLADKVAELNGSWAFILALIGLTATWCTINMSPIAEHLGRSKTAALSILSEMAQRLRETNALLSQRAATNAVKEIEENLTWGQRLADKVAELNGSWAFILFILFLSAGWSISNSILARSTFDPYPYQFYNLFLAVLVALQGPLIVMSQNRQTMKDRAQAETDFRVNLKNEVGIESLQRDLAAFRAETTTRLEVLERMARAERVRAEVPVKMPGGPLAAAKSPSETT
jgi:uncharacterized membrane protein